MSDLKLGWEFLRISKAITFTCPYGEEIIHFIRTGFSVGESTYHVVQEDAHEIKPDGKDYLMTSSQIKEKFGIDIDEAFHKHLKIKELSDEQITEMLENSWIKNKDGIYELDYIEFIKDLDYGTASRVFGIIHQYAITNKMAIITATQKEE